MSQTNLQLSARSTRRSRRDDLLAIAARLFAERGFAGVTVDDIGAASGVSGPALYHHFAGKEAMLGEMLVSISEHLLDGARRIAADAARTTPALPALIRAHARFAVEHPDLITVQYRDLVHAADHDHRAVRSLQGRYVEIWVDDLVRQEPALERRSARAAVHAALGLLNSTPFSARLGREVMARLLVDMTTRALDPGQLLGNERPGIRSGLSG